jgi:hypothetical protein
LTFRGFASGLLTAGLYLAVAALSFRHGPGIIRPVFDGLAPPPPYRWVDPPRELAEDNIPARGGGGTVEFGPTGSVAKSITTGDGQASVIFPAGSLAPRPDQPSVRVEIEPEDPDSIAPPPSRLFFDGNAYEVGAIYAPSGEPVVLTGTDKVQIVLRYPRHATRMLRWNGSAWEILETTTVSQSLQLLANIPDVGTFVAAGPPQSDALPPEVTPWWAYAAAGGGLLLVSLGALKRIRSAPSGLNDARAGDRSGGDR